MARTLQKSATPQKPVSAPQQLDLISLRDFEYRIGFSREKLKEVALTPDSYYSPFPLPPKPLRPFAKKIPKQKIRMIDRPKGCLLEIQKRIYQRLLRNLEVPSYICGGVKGRSVLMNVKFHGGAAVIVNLDIKSWFPSITSRHVYRVWRRILNCSRPVARLLTKLTVFQGRLPQGAPTSTPLANLVLYSIDKPIREAALVAGVGYSAWVDDLPFSGANARNLIPIAISTLKRAGFRVARPKLVVSGGSKRKMINGVIAGSVPSASKQHRGRIRASLHRLRVGDVPLNERAKRVVSIRGSISHLATISPGHAEKFRRELAQLVEDGIRK